MVSPKMGLREAWRIYREKAPVNLPGCQIKVRRAWHVIWPHLTRGEVLGLSIGLGHAGNGEGWQDFADACRVVEARLFPK